MNKTKSYEYVFPAITDYKETLHIYDKNNGKEYRLKIGVGDLAFRNTQSGILSSLLADLVDLSVAIYVSDWLLPKEQNAKSRINIQLPLRNVEIFGCQVIKEQLQELLYWYTLDDWQFNFIPRQQKKRLAELKPKLALAYTSAEVALWSGGLDSLAGATDRIASKTSERYTFFGTGSNNQVLGKQKEIFRKLRQKSENTKLIRVPIKLEFEANSRLGKNKSFRARGMTFKLLGAVCALLEGQKKLHIYENGYGALNLPFSKAGTSIMHTRSVHPTSLCKLGKFVSTILEQQFIFENPYIFHTKAQMCKRFQSESEIAFATISCDGPHRCPDKPSQCGYCSSCLLRRLALWQALGIDKTDYVVNYKCVASDSERNHFLDMDFQVTKIMPLLLQEDTWQQLVNYHPRFPQIVNDLSEVLNISQTHVQTQIVRLLQTHCSEWEKNRSVLAN